MRPLPVLALVFLVLVCAPQAAAAQFGQQGPKLVGIGATGNAFQGWSVALSADGNTAIVGGYQDNSYAGAAWVFTRSDGVWSQQGDKLVGTGATGNALQGYSVAISADGDTAIVGAYGDNSGTGATWVFTRGDGGWSQQGNKLVGTGATGNALQGWSVALSADGNTAIVGGYKDNSDLGAAWVFTRSGGVWSQQGDKLVGGGAVWVPQQGTSVALSADGNTAIVGGPQDDFDVGAVWVFTRSGGTWSQQGAKLVGTGATWMAYQGYSVALSADGNTAIEGSYRDSGDDGAVWVFTRSSGVWSQQGSKLVGSGAMGSHIFQGHSVALSADGNTAITGGRADNDGAGAAWVFIRRDGVWSQQGHKLVGTGAVGYGAGQGSSVALSADGNAAVVGGWQDDNNVGAAWVFVRADDLAVDRGSRGLWVRYNDSTWSKRHAASPESLASGDLDGNGVDELIADRGADGLWARYNNKTWKKLNASSPQTIATGDLDGDRKDEVIADFGNKGLKAYYSKTKKWKTLRDEDVQGIATGNLDGNGKEELIADRGGAGLWAFYNNKTWKKLNASSPQTIATGDLDGDGKDEIVADFGNKGLKAYYSKTKTWKTLRSENVQDIATGNLDGTSKEELIADRGGKGLWAFYDNSTWTKLHDDSPQGIATGDLDADGKDEIVADFGAGGLWAYFSRTHKWRKLRNDNVEDIATGSFD